MTKEGKVIKEGYSAEAKEQWKEEPITGDVSLRVEVYHDSKRKNDIDNFNKILFDSLTGIVWVDDQQVQELTLSKRYDKDNPRIELTIKEL
jgi:Holliday junction resolvase RusA-like endonuclease